MIEDLKKEEEQDSSIVELAECVKELCRIVEMILPVAYRESVGLRLESCYKKASQAKNRVNSL